MRSLRTDVAKQRRQPPGCQAPPFQGGEWLTSVSDLAQWFIQKKFSQKIPERYSGYLIATITDKYFYLELALVSYCDRETIAFLPIFF